MIGGARTALMKSMTISGSKVGLEHAPLGIYLFYISIVNLFLLVLQKFFKYSFLSFYHEANFET